MLPFLVHKIFTFYTNGVLNCKCPAPGPKDQSNADIYFETKIRQQNQLSIHPCNKKCKFISFLRRDNPLAFIVANQFTHKNVSTDMIVLAGSCHPPRHRDAALRYNINTTQCTCWIDRKKAMNPK